MRLLKMARKVFLGWVGSGLRKVLKHWKLAAQNGSLGCSAKGVKLSLKSNRILLRFFFLLFIFFVISIVAAVYRSKKTPVLWLGELIQTHLKSGYFHSSNPSASSCSLHRTEELPVCSDNPTATIISWFGFCNTWNANYAVQSMQLGCCRSRTIWLDIQLVSSGRSAMKLGLFRPA